MTRRGAGVQGERALASRFAILRPFAAFLVALAALFGAAPARAQVAVDANALQPNVLLLLDNSGSMEYMIDGTSPTCTPGVQTTPNRWGTLIQVLTGSLFPFYSCIPEPRTVTPLSASGITAWQSFDTEYSLSGSSPYDLNYVLNYNRPLIVYDSASPSNPTNPTTDGSKWCVNARGALPATSGFDDFTNSVVGKTWTGGATCPFTQKSDGLLDGPARDLIRFGVMTFDSFADPGTGTDSNQFTGMWSYFPGWNTFNRAAQAGNCDSFVTGTAWTSLANNLYACGWPSGCSATSTRQYEVGARNPNAPPWEGRMLGFPPADADLATVEQWNDRVQLVVKGTRPYGSTPIAGMLDDARYFFKSDTTYGPSGDNYVTGACRPEYIILLTDGAPNMDMRGYCDAAGTPSGRCPYDTPVNIVTDLKNGTPNIYTYVVGFAVTMSSTQTLNCSSLYTNGTVPDCSAAGAYSSSACCTLQNIAAAGGTTKAYWADNAADLANVLNVIVQQMTRNISSRTAPSYSPVVTGLGSSDSSFMMSSMLMASMYPWAAQSTTWAGTVQRSRYACPGGTAQTGTAVSLTSTLANGDDFAYNLNRHPTSRVFSSFAAELSSTARFSDNTIRPHIPTGNPDGLGTYGRLGGYVGHSSQPKQVLYLDGKALGVTGNEAACTDTTGTAHLTADQCATLAMSFAIGEASAVTPTTTPFASRQNLTYDPVTNPMPSVMGAVIHSTPRSVGPPNGLLRDPTYLEFQKTWATRKMVTYVETSDGLLHAFDSGPNIRNANASNELWAFIPPGVLPGLLGQYPNHNYYLLDGSPVVKDVVWDRTSSRLNNSVTGATDWHTMLVSGFGIGGQTDATGGTGSYSYGRGYFALDVTDPTAPGASTPKFRWQLSTFPGATQLFGQASATPAITTVYADPGDGLGVREIGVAILPGGKDGNPTGAPCTRALKTAGTYLSNHTQWEATPETNYGYRTSVQCWSSNYGRSVSVVRIDTGEIIRTFMRAAEAPTSTFPNFTAKVKDTPLDSPMTGVPVVFPADVGAIARKFFVGDSDGTMWRFDVSDSNPSNWKGEMFYDLYNATTDSSTTAWSDADPVLIEPVVSINRSGQLTLAVASSDPLQFTSSGANYVVSLSEATNTAGSKLIANVNWWITLSSGEHVAGPMAVFNSVLYFATYKRASGNALCSGGTASIYGRDYVTPWDTTNLPASLGRGGYPRLADANGTFPASLPPPVAAAGKVIPGVTVNMTPVCADIAAATDPYVAGGSMYGLTNISTVQYSLSLQYGVTQSGAGSMGGTGSYNWILPTPTSPTLIDSWAAVVE